MKFVILVSLLFTVFASSALGAEKIPDKWWRLKPAKKLNLSIEVIKQLDHQYIASKRKLIDLKSGVEKAQFELNILLEQEELDENAVMKAFQDLEKTRSNLATERFSYLIQVRKIIGYENYIEVKNFFRKRKVNNKKKRPTKNKKKKNSSQ